MYTTHALHTGVGLEHILGRLGYMLLLSAVLFVSPAAIECSRSLCVWGLIYYVRSCFSGTKNEASCSSASNGKRLKHVISKSKDSIGVHDDSSSNDTKKGSFAWKLRGGQLVRLIHVHSRRG